MEHRFAWKAGLIAVGPLLEDPPKADDNFILCCGPQTPLKGYSNRGLASLFSKKKVDS